MFRAWVRYNYLYMEHERKRGFTLIEIIIVIAITTLLSGIIITYTSTGRSQVSLYVEEAKVAQTILRAKALSIATYTQSDPTLPVTCGYGFHMDYTSGAQTYSIFRYSLPSGSSCAGIQNAPLDPTAMTFIKTENLNPVLKFVQDITPNSASVDDVLFVPPGPRAYIWTEGGTDGTNPQGVVYMNTKNGSANVNIYINYGGQISFQANT